MTAPLSRRLVFATRFQLSALIGLALMETPTVAAEASDLVVPPGYGVQKVAGSPEIRFPMFGTFDDRGRLFIAESSGLDLYAELQKLSRTCRISVLEDRDGDGRFEVSRVFADQLVFPMGLVWQNGRLYVADPPKVVTFEDTDGDGRADKRTAILGDFGHKDNGSLHGLIFGPDGWLYMTMGRPDGYRFQRVDGSILSGESGALIRCRADGSDVEVVCRGFENLIEVDFHSTGEIIGTDNWFNLPSAGMRDALVHLLEGGLYPMSLRDAGTPMLVSGEPLPSIAGYPAVAFSGLTRYRGTTFHPEAYGGYFSAQHNTRKVVQHRFERSGATFQTTDVDFLSTQDPDFHPSDVVEDADGSLIVIDTGSWYIQHCPTGRIRNSPAPGGIFRIRYLESQPVPDPWGTALDWSNSSAEQLANGLQDPRPAVRHRAADQLVRKGAEATIPLSRLLATTTAMPVVEPAVWTLARIPGAGQFLIALLASDSSDVTALAARALGRSGVPEASGPLLLLLNHPASHVRLAAAEALVRCGGPALVPQVFLALARNQDRFVEHGLIHILYRWASRVELLRALDSSSPRVQKAAFVLLDQHPHNALTANTAVARLFHQDPDLRQAARAALAQHPDWVQPALPALRNAAQAAHPEPSDLAMLKESVLAFWATPAFADLIAALLVDMNRVAIKTRLALLESIARMPGNQIPVSWSQALGSLLAFRDEELQLQAAKTARALQLPALDASLAALAHDPSQPPNARIEAMAAVVRRQPELPESGRELLLTRLAGTNAANVRLTAAEILSQARLSGAHLIQFVQRAKGDPILAPSLLLSAAQRSPEATLAASELLGYIQQYVRADLPIAPEVLGWLETILPASAKAGIQELRQISSHRDDRQKAQLGELEPLLSGGDPNRGHELFVGKATCVTCHQVGQRGGLVGPDLTKIGAVRSGRDLIESLVVPSATFAQGYDTYVVLLKNGDSFSGVRVRQPDETFVLREVGGAEVRLDASQIESLRRSPISVMPDGLLSTLSQSEIRDLLAYLQDLK